MAPSDPIVKVVTVSATYGAGGSVIAPQLAERLGLPFFDRLIHGVDRPTVEGLAERLTSEERNQAPPGRIVAGLSSMSGALGLSVPDAGDLDPVATLRRQVETSVSRVATSTGGVILGRAAAVVLASHPGVFHVRLHGPEAKCLAIGMRMEGASASQAKEFQADTDRARARFVSRLFDRDASDPRLYHLVIDSTALSFGYCVSMISDAANQFWSFDPNEAVSS